MRVYSLLGDMTFEVDRISGVREALADRARALPRDAALAKRLETLAAQVDEMRKKIVATKEGGSVTGEQRIREKSTQLYGDILNYEGRPADYQVTRIDSLGKELGDVRTEFNALASKELPAINRLLRQKKLAPIEVLTRQAWDATSSETD